MRLLNYASLVAAMGLVLSLHAPAEAASPSATTKCSETHGTIVKHGTSLQDSKNALKAINDVRTAALEGRLTGRSGKQPKAIKMPMLTWDSTLAAQAQILADTCKLGHGEFKDSRFYVGQNLYKLVEPKEPLQDWKKPVEAWSSEVATMCTRKMALIILIIC